MVVEVAVAVAVVEAVVEAVTALEGWLPMAMTRTTRMMMMRTTDLTPLSQPPLPQLPLPPLPLPPPISPLLLPQVPLRQAPPVPPLSLSVSLWLWLEQVGQVGQVRVVRPSARTE